MDGITTPNPFEEAPPPAPGLPSVHRVEFRGVGTEYFRIWIVNTALSLITLGIYSAWAKVRQLNYFYRSTSMAGASFEYHGQPIAILKGRILALVLVFLWNVAPEIHPVAFGIVVAGALVVVPWLITNALRFRLHNSSYRGLRFSFLGRVKETARVFLLFGLLTMVTFGLALPYFQWRIKRYFFDHSAYGTLHARFQAKAGAFYRAYVGVGLFSMLIPLTFFLVILVLFEGQSLTSGNWNAPWNGSFQDNIGMIIVAAFFAFLMYLGMWAWLRARLFAICWHDLQIGGHRITCDLSAWKFAGTAVFNLFLIFITLGLYKPFNDIQLTRLLADSLQFHCTTDLSEAVASVVAENRAGGEEAADFFDMDIGL